MESRSSDPRGRWTLLGFVGLGLILYGPSLGIGYLSDDFLYLAALEEGFGPLLGHLTVDSNPRMIRPLSAIGWLLSPVPGGAGLQHLLSLFLHVAAAWLVFRLVASRGPADGGSPSRQATLCGLLFLACPLLTEPVLWLSAAPDLWATGLALGAVALLRFATPFGLFGSVFLFAGALLAKESVVVLPLIVLCWWLAERDSLPAGRLVFASGVLGAAAATYLIGRWWLFGGLGGYLDASGRSIAAGFDLVTYLRNLGLQLPWRLLMPWKRSGVWWLPVAGLSVGLLAWLGVRARLWRVLTQSGDRRRFFYLVAAFGASTLPVAPVLSVDVDHGGGRLIYFPLAVGLVGCGRLLGALPERDRRAVTAPLVVLLLGWMVALSANTRSWRAAGREVGETLDHLQANASQWSPGTTVWVDGHDSWHGAYVWRNGFDFALRRVGLEPRRPWRLGTLARAPEALADGSLGRSVFQIARVADGEWADRTECYRALAAVAGPPLAQFEVGANLAVHEFEVRVDGGLPAVAVFVRSEDPVSGHLWWLHDGIPRFNPTERRAFRSDLQRPGVLALPAVSGQGDYLRIGLELAPESTGAVSGVEVVAAPPACGRS